MTGEVAEAPVPEIPVVLEAQADTAPPAALPEVDAAPAAAPVADAVPAATEQPAPAVPIGQGVAPQPLEASGDALPALDAGTQGQAAGFGDVAVEEQG